MNDYLIIENGEEWGINQEMATLLVDNGMIYQCDDSEHNGLEGDVVFHLNPVFEEFLRKVLR